MSAPGSKSENIGSKVDKDWASKVEAHLVDEQPLNEHERRVAYAAWLHALSERRSKQLAVLTIPTAAVALIAALTALIPDGSSDSDGSPEPSGTPSPAATPEPSGTPSPAATPDLGGALDLNLLVSVIGIASIVAVAIIVAWQLMVARDIEAFKAAAAVHEHRASGCSLESANSPTEDESADDSDGDEPADGADGGEQPTDEKKDGRGRGHHPSPSH